MKMDKNLKYYDNLEAKTPEERKTDLENIVKSFQALDEAVFCIDTQLHNLIEELKLANTCKVEGDAVPLDKQIMMVNQVYKQLHDQVLSKKSFLQDLCAGVEFSLLNKDVSVFGFPRPKKWKPDISVPKV